MTPLTDAGPDRRAPPARGVARRRGPTSTATTGAPRSPRSRCSTRTSADGDRDVDRRRCDRPPAAEPDARLGRARATARSPTGGPSTSTLPRAGRAARRPRRAGRARSPRPARAARRGRPRDLRAGRPTRSSTCPASTGVHTTAAEAWDAARRASARTWRTSRSAALRSVGIPARYVSGYLHPTPDAGDRRDRRRRVARLGRVVGRRLARLRPDQRRRARRPPRPRRPRPRLRRREAALRHLLRRRHLDACSSTSRSPASSSRRAGSSGTPYDAERDFVDALRPVAEHSHPTGVNAPRPPMAMLQTCRSRSGGSGTPRCLSRTVPGSSPTRC